MFIKSAQAKQTFLNVERTNSAKQCAVFLNNNGMPIYQYLSTIHSLAGIPRYVPPSAYYTSANVSTQGFSSFMTALTQSLPVQQFRNTFIHYKTSSVPFGNLVTAVRSSQGQGLTLAITLDPTFVLAVTQFKLNGTDIIATINFVFQVFGIIL